MRDITERPKGIDTGTANLVDTDMQRIISQVELLLNDQIEYDKMSKAINPYGDDNAQGKIYMTIENKFKVNKTHS